MSYLEIKKENFYRIEATASGKRFVTARGWEDLSDMIKACEILGTPVDEALIVQYLQHPIIAKDFAGYYDLYKKYEKDYDAAQIVNGKWQAVTVEKLRDAAFDEKVTMIGLLTSSLNEAFMSACLLEDYTQQLFEILKSFKVKISEASDADGFDVLSATVSETGSRLIKDKAAGLLDAWQFKVGSRVVKQLEAFQSQCRANGLKGTEEVFAFVKEALMRRLAGVRQLWMKPAKSFIMCLNF